MTERIPISELIEGVDELASLPEAVRRANQLIDSDTASIDDIAEVIALDPSFSARLLKLVNSAFYGFAAQIDSITRALTLIGTRELRSLILSASSVDVFNRIAPGSMDMNDFWFRSVFVGLAARHLAGDRKIAEQMFLMGLMHNVGRIVLFSARPDMAQEILEQVGSSGRPMHEVERDLLGFTSADISAALLKNWQLAETLWKPLEYMYRLDAAGGYARQAAILQLAARLADCEEPELKSRNADALARVKEEYELLDLARTEAQDLDGIVTEVNIENIEVLGVIYPGAMMVF